MLTAWNAPPGELPGDRTEHDDFSEAEELVRVNGELLERANEMQTHVVSILGESRRQRTTLRQLAEAALGALPQDDRTFVITRFGYVAANDSSDIPF
jgi:hypothetical protein